MVEIETKARKWGDSIAVIIPREIVHEEGIKQNDFLRIVIQKEYDLTELFGRLKIKKTAQQLKNESRKYWK